MRDGRALPPPFVSMRANLLVLPLLLAPSEMDPNSIMAGRRRPPPSPTRSSSSSSASARLLALLLLLLLVLSLGTLRLGAALVERALTPAFGQPLARPARRLPLLAVFATLAPPLPPPPRPTRLAGCWGWWWPRGLPPAALALALGRPTVRAVGLLPASSPSVGPLLGWTALLGPLVLTLGPLCQVRRRRRRRDLPSLPTPPRKGGAGWPSPSTQHAH